MYTDGSKIFNLLTELFVLHKFTYAIVIFAPKSQSLRPNKVETYCEFQGMIWSMHCVNGHKAMEDREMKR